MKVTGIVRRIDDLGRVVIPKEIRRTLNIKEGDPLELYTDNDGGIVFRKYQTTTETITAECAKLVASAIKNGFIYNLFIEGDAVTICTPKGKATAKRNPQDTFDLNVGVCAALAKLNYLKMPDGLS
ncbi:MAG: AbrB/MazE/SpoVT family DNA-binding domain-containing protein [Ruminococcus sp.]|nr:AbrB/MazE/SpoVT family DNA-binding domain-containing protein [Candidatus Copronaster equi]